MSECTLTCCVLSCSRFSSVLFSKKTRHVYTQRVALSAAFHFWSKIWEQSRGSLWCDRAEKTRTEKGAGKKHKHFCPRAQVPAVAWLWSSLTDEGFLLQRCLPWDLAFHRETQESITIPSDFRYHPETQQPCLGPTCRGNDVCNSRQLLGQAKCLASGVDRHINNEHKNPS